jgi:hypothetical protein
VRVGYFFARYQISIGLIVVPASVPADTVWRPYPHPSGFLPAGLRVFSTRCHLYAQCSRQRNLDDRAFVHGRASERDNNIEVANKPCMLACMFADESEGPAFHALSAVDDACGLAAGPYTYSTTAICDDRFRFLSS